MRNGWTIPEYRYQRFVVQGTCDDTVGLWWYRPEAGVQERIICGIVTLSTGLAAGNRIVTLGLWSGADYLCRVNALNVQGASTLTRYSWLDGLQGGAIVNLVNYQIPWGYEIWIDREVYIRGTVVNEQEDDRFFTAILLVERTIRD